MDLVLENECWTVYKTNVQRNRPRKQLGVLQPRVPKKKVKSRKSRKKLKKKIWMSRTPEVIGSQARHQEPVGKLELGGVLCPAVILAALEISRPVHVLYSNY